MEMDGRAVVAVACGDSDFDLLGSSGEEGVTSGPRWFKCVRLGANIGGQRGAAEGPAGAREREAISVRAAWRRPGEDAFAGVFAGNWLQWGLARAGLAEFRRF